MIKYDGTNFRDSPGAETIYTLDIETTSLFRDPSGEWKVFDYSKPPEYYQGCLKVGIPYIWMFGVNDTVYYGTEFADIEKILLAIADGSRMKIVWIHNSSFEFQFMRDFLEHYTIKRMIARAVRKPITYSISELNIQVRCTYMLTNMSLARAAERFTDARKKVGDLEYNKARHPGTVQYMTETELSYCEYDCLVLEKTVRYFLRQYKRLDWIPLTQTGIVRKEYRKRVDFHYICKLRKKVPDDRLYLIMQKAFQGGIAHGNALYIGKVVNDVLSFDIASSYPTTFLFKLPGSKFRPITPERADSMPRDKYAVLYHVKFYNIRAAKLNKYILNSKIATGKNVYADNGRLISADEIEMYLTESDYDIIVGDAYECERREVLEAWYSVKSYLPIELVRFALELYNDKTRLKNIPSEADFYMRQKEKLNSLFGCSTTNILKSGVRFDMAPESDTQDWILPTLTLEYVHETLDQLRTSKTNCFLYQWGCWITCEARARLWRVISQLDDLVIYYDTDSVKVRNDPRVFAVIERENEIIKERLRKACEDMEIDPALLEPEDTKGIKHPLGLWENEKDRHAAEFITQGAKRYAFRTYDGKLHCVVSGVNNKTGYKALNDDIRNFRKALTFDYEAANKLTSYYNDNQPEVTFRDYLGNVYTSHQRHGICLQPVEYNMSISPAFEAYIEETQNGFNGGEWIK